MSPLDGGPDRAHGHDLVRPYMMTGGRTKAARRDLRFETMVATTGDATTQGLPAEQVAILEVCRSPIALAEVAARLGLVVSVASILVSDLVAEGRLEVHQTDPVEIELDMLHRMIDAVKSR